MRGLRARRRGRRVALLTFQAERARAHYRRRRPCCPEDRRSMLSAQMMGAVYRALLDAWSVSGSL